MTEPEFQTDSHYLILPVMYPSASTSAWLKHPSIIWIISIGRGEGVKEGASTSNLQSSIHAVPLHGKIISSHYYSTKHCKFSIKHTTRTSPTSQAANSAEIKSTPIFTLWHRHRHMLNISLFGTRGEETARFQMQIKRNARRTVRPTLRVHTDVPCFVVPQLPVPAWWVHCQNYYSKTFKMLV